MEVYRTSINRFWVRYNTGCTRDRPRSGRPRPTTPAQNRYIRDRFRTATSKASQIPELSRISFQTVINRLRQAGLQARRPVRHRLLFSRYNISLNDRCQEHIRWKRTHLFRWISLHVVQVDVPESNDVIMNVTSPIVLWNIHRFGGVSRLQNNALNLLDILNTCHLWKVTRHKPTWRFINTVRNLEVYFYITIRQNNFNLVTKLVGQNILIAKWQVFCKL